MNGRFLTIMTIAPPRANRPWSTAAVDEFEHYHSKRFGVGSQTETSVVGTGLQR